MFFCLSFRTKDSKDGWTNNNKSHARPKFPNFSASKFARYKEEFRRQLTRFKMKQKVLEDSAEYPWHSNPQQRYLDYSTVINKQPLPDTHQLQHTQQYQQTDYISQAAALRRTRDTGRTIHHADSAFHGSTDVQLQNNVSQHEGRDDRHDHRETQIQGTDSHHQGTDTRFRSSNLQASGTSSQMRTEMRLQGTNSQTDFRHQGTNSRTDSRLQGTNSGSQDTLQSVSGYTSLSVNGFSSAASSSYYGSSPGGEGRRSRSDAREPAISEERYGYHNRRSRSAGSGSKVQRLQQLFNKQISEETPPHPRSPRSPRSPLSPKSSLIETNALSPVVVSRTAQNSVARKRLIFENLAAEQKRSASMSPERLLGTPFRRQYMARNRSADDVLYHNRNARNGDGYSVRDGRLVGEEDRTTKSSVNITTQRQYLARNRSADDALYHNRKETHHQYGESDRTRGQGEEDRTKHTRNSAHHPNVTVTKNYITHHSATNRQYNKGATSTRCLDAPPIKHRSNETMHNDNPPFCDNNTNSNNRLGGHQLRKPQYFPYDRSPVSNTTIFTGTSLESGLDTGYNTETAFSKKSTPDFNRQRNNSFGETLSEDGILEGKRRSRRKPSTTMQDILQWITPPPSSPPPLSPSSSSIPPPPHLLLQSPSSSSTVQHQMSQYPDVIAQVAATCNPNQWCDDTDTTNHIHRESSPLKFSSSKYKEENNNNRSFASLHSTHEQLNLKGRTMLQNESNSVYGSSVNTSVSIAKVDYSEGYYNLNHVTTKDKDAQFMNGYRTERERTQTGAMYRSSIALTPSQSQHSQEGIHAQYSSHHQQTLSPSQSQTPHPQYSSHNSQTFSPSSQSHPPIQPPSYSYSYSSSPYIHHSSSSSPYTSSSCAVHTGGANSHHMIYSSASSSQPISSHNVSSSYTPVTVRNHPLASRHPPIPSVMPDYVPWQTKASPSSSTVIHPAVSYNNSPASLSTYSSPPLRHNSSQNNTNTLEESPPEPEPPPVPPKLYKRVDSTIPPEVLNRPLPPGPPPPKPARVLKTWAESNAPRSVTVTSPSRSDVVITVSSSKYYQGSNQGHSEPEVLVNHRQNQKQSVNQSWNQSVNQPINQRYNQSVNQVENQSMNPSVNHSVNQRHNQPSWQSHYTQSHEVQVSSKYQTSSILIETPQFSAQFQTSPQTQISPVPPPPPPKLFPSPTSKSPKPPAPNPLHSYVLPSRFFPSPFGNHAIPAPPRFHSSPVRKDISTELSLRPQSKLHSSPLSPKSETWLERSDQSDAWLKRSNQSKAWVEQSASKPSPSSSSVLQSEMSLDPARSSSQNPPSFVSMRSKLSQPVNNQSDNETPLSFPGYTLKPTVLNFDTPPSKSYSSSTSLRSKLSLPISEQSHTPLSSSVYAHKPPVLSKPSTPNSPTLFTPLSSSRYDHMSPTSPLKPTTPPTSLISPLSSKYTDKSPPLPPKASTPPTSLFSSPVINHRSHPPSPSLSKSHPSSASLASKHSLPLSDEFPASSSPSKPSTPLCDPLINQHLRNMQHVYQLQASDLSRGEFEIIRTDTEHFLRNNGGIINGGINGGNNGSLKPHLATSSPLRFIVDSPASNHSSSANSQQALQQQQQQQQRMTPVGGNGLQPAVMGTGGPQELYPYDVMVKRRENEGFGFVIISSVTRAGSVIGRIIENSPAERCKRLHVGDRILAVNGTSIMHMHHEDIVNLIKDSGTSVSLTVGPPLGEKDDASSTASNSQRSSQGSMINAMAFPTHSESDLSRRSEYSPYHNKPQQQPQLRQYPEDHPQEQEEDKDHFYAVELHRGSRGFGFSIRGGKEFNNMALYVLKIAEGGAADVDRRLRVGDQIIEINGYNTSNMTHAEAIELIQSGGASVKMLVKRTAKANQHLGGPAAGVGGVGVGVGVGRIPLSSNTPSPHNGPQGSALQQAANTQHNHSPHTRQYPDPYIQQQQQQQQQRYNEPVQQQRHNDPNVYHQQQQQQQQQYGNNPQQQQYNNYQPQQQQLYRTQQQYS